MSDKYIEIKSVDFKTINRILCAFANEIGQRQGRCSPGIRVEVRQWWDSVLWDSALMYKVLIPKKWIRGAIESDFIDSILRGEDG